MAKKGSVRLTNLMEAFTVPTKFLLALADYVVWKQINYKTILNASYFYDLMISIYTDGTSDGTKKTNSENISIPKAGVLNVEFALKLRIYRSLKSLICLK